MAGIMAERLSQDAKHVLAFVTAHPGSEAKDIALEMGMDLASATSILTGLAKKEIIQAEVAQSDDEDEFEVTRFYPNY